MDKVHLPIIFAIGSGSISGLPRSGKKFWKMKNFPGQGKVRELHFQSGKFKKMKKSHGKVREFQNFPKKMLVNRLLEIFASNIRKGMFLNINCKQFMFRNIPFLIFMV